MNDPLKDISTENDAQIKRLTDKLDNAFKNLGLTPFSSSVAKQYLIGKLNDGMQDKFSHVIRYVVDLINNKQRFTNNDVEPESLESNLTQSGCPNLIVGLTARPFWETHQFSWVIELESRYDDIRREFMSLRDKQKLSDTSNAADADGNKNDGGFQHYRSPKSNVPSSSGGRSSNGNSLSHDQLGSIATSKGAWNVCYLYLHGMDFAGNLAACPVTTQTIQAIPRHYHHAMFSALAPDTHVKAHFGPTNKKLRCHLPIYIPDDGTGELSSLTVAGETRYLTEGKAVIFDDSFLHEAANHSKTEPRVVLIVDFWHPDLSDEEVRFFEFINNAQIKAAQRLSKLNQQQEDTIDIATPTSTLTLTATECSDLSCSKSNSNSNCNSEDFFSVIQRGKLAGISSEDQHSIWTSSR